MKNKITNPQKANLVERWKKYVVAGNQSLINKDYRSASRHYELARQCAESVFLKWSEPNESVSALVVTYHNIADLHQAQGNKGSILHYLEKIHKILLHALATTPIEHERHVALLAGSKRTYAALVNFKKFGTYE